DRQYLIYGICVTSIGGGIVIASLNLRYPMLYNWWQNSSLLAFAPYWWIGAAVVVPGIRDALKTWGVALLLAFVCLTFLSHLETTAIIAEIRKPILAALIALLIVVLDEARLGRNPLSALGRSSYSLYAIHAPLSIFLLISGFPWWLTIL